LERAAAARAVADTGVDSGFPAGLQARLDDLCVRVAASEPPAGGWRTVGREHAARQLAEQGMDLGTARGMVTDYLRETSDRAQVPADHWGLDQSDLAEIADTAQRHGYPPPTTADGAGYGGAASFGDEAGADRYRDEGWSR
jgi:hypothetical protein